MELEEILKMKKLLIKLITIVLLYSCSEGRWIGGNAKHFQERHDYQLRMDSIKLAKR